MLLRPQTDRQAALCAGAEVPVPLLGGEAADARALLLPAAGGAAASCPAPCRLGHGWRGAGQGVRDAEEITSP